ncbi:MAG: BrnT family toxin [Alphaproteobacteria bacterium]|nr:BrnT family toxin [Alphaproteobacteria bacterium]
MAKRTIFEWDADKSDATLRRRGFDFDYALQIFEGKLVEVLDSRRDYGEVRIRATGAFGNDVLTVIYTVRGDTIRIISARRASRKERRSWLGRE